MIGIKKDFISLADFSKEELELILETAFDLKRKLMRGEPHRLLEDKSLGMLFAQPSTRTRISFETAMTQLGGHAQFYTTETLQLAHKETWKDTARTMDRYIDGIAIRMYNIKGLGPWDTRDILRLIADNAEIPVINMLDDLEHPCQVISDVMTMREKLGDLKGKKIVMSWAYSERRKSPGVPHAMILAASILGFDLTLAYPVNYELDDYYLKKAQEFSGMSGAKIVHVHDLKEAAKGADIIYAKSWGSRKMTEDEDRKNRDRIKDDWIVNDEVMSLTAKNGKYMHCLPADRGQEVTDSVIDGDRSIVYDQLENRLHAQKAILALLMR
jgi:ornithine carbamoyltransferase